MRKGILLVTLVLSSFLSQGQHLPAQEMRDFFARASLGRTTGDTVSSVAHNPNGSSAIPSGAFGVIQKLNALNHSSTPAIPSGGDTLVIGVSPLDSLTITGTFLHNGPVMVLGNGILRFKNANATIVGDLIVWGDHALVTADSSYLYFPQQYFYQRSLVIAGKGNVVYRNTTLDHSGLSHNLVLTDSARIELDKVTNIGFTTCGMNKASEISVDGINQAGEFIIYEQSRLIFRNAKTILLWFQVPATGIFHYSFPDGDTVQSFALSNTTPGISGIEYSVRADSCTDVMWALMPVTGSDVSISASKIRSIGLWFLGHDTIAVSGLVDNSVYTDFLANLTDRSLRLINSGVQTWSLYPMDTVYLNITGCILGEIGSESNCTVVTSDAFVDGSGGYWWSANHSFMVGENCMAVNAIRSSETSIFLFAYSSLNSGEAAALGNSIMMIVQSQLPGLPSLYDGSCVWYSRIDSPSTAFADSLVPLSGSAWIDKTSSSPLMDFGWYRMYWQKSGDSAWHPIGERQYTEKREEILAAWDTHGLGPGLYYLKLVLTDNTPDSNQNEAVKGISLLPKIFGISENYLPDFSFRICPDPVNENSVIRFSLDREELFEISIVNPEGKIVSRTSRKFDKGMNNFSMGTLVLPAGCYTCIMKSKYHLGVQKFIAL
jgi:hypothetical protein